MLTHTLAELVARYVHDCEATGDAIHSPPLDIIEFTEHVIVGRADHDTSHARPGGMVAGSSLFKMVDAIGYLVTLARSPKGSHAFTVDVSMRFLRPAPVGDLFIEGRSLQFSKRLSVIDTRIFSPRSGADPIASAVVTFAPVFWSPSTGSELR